MVKSKICSRCILRYLNAYHNDLLRKPEDEIREELEKRWPSLAKITLSPNQEQNDAGKEDSGGNIKIRACQSCLGMLQDEFLVKWTDSVSKAISDESYIFKSFKLMVSQPVQLLLCDRAVLNEHKEFLQEHQGQGKRLEVKDIFKIFMEPKLEKIHQAKAVVNDSDLEITLIFKHKLTENELLPKIEENFPRCFAKAKHQLSIQTRKRPRNDLTIFTAAAMTEALAAMGAEGLNEFLEDKYFYGGVTLDEVKMMHSPIYLAGRYNKYSRKLPQTPWILNGERIAEMSVQEYITEPITQSCPSDSCNFSSSGREDVDVRMLGNGRPFIVELKNPRNYSSLVQNIKKIQKEINESTKKISIKDLQIIQKDDIKLLKEGEEEKTKTYSSLCCARIPSEKLACENGDHVSTLDEIKLKIIGLSSVKDHVIEQKTPLRVLHRRNLAVRKRTVHSMSAEIVENSKNDTADLDLSLSFSFDNLLLFKLSMTTQAGTYVKEFVHGDFGRTTPYLGSIIGTETDIVSLDVTAVNIDWPPQVNA